MYGIHINAYILKSVPSGLSHQSKQILRLVESWVENTNQRNIKSAFKVAGIDTFYDMSARSNKVTDSARLARHYENIEERTLSKTRLKL